MLKNTNKNNMQIINSLLHAKHESNFFRYIDSSIYVGNYKTQAKLYNNNKIRISLLSLDRDLYMVLSNLID